MSQQRLELLNVTDDDDNSKYFVEIASPEHQTKSLKSKKAPNPLKTTEDSEGKISGFVCCPLWCYTKRCVLFSIIITVLFSIVSIGVLIGFSVSVAHPYFHVSGFVKGQCTVEYAEYTPDLGKCGCSYGGRSCLFTYPCLQIRVVYYTKEDGHDHHSILYATDEEHSYASHCSITPHCESGSVNKKEVEDFKMKYGTRGQTLMCYHHPSDSGAIIKHVDRSNHVLHILLWPCLVATLSVLSCIFVFFHCLPKYCNKAC